MKKSVCKYCGKPGMSHGRSLYDKQLYKKICGRCDAQIKRTGYPYGIHKKSVCEKCGFVPVNPCQLCVDHVDGDKMNNDLDNLQTLCHNCHFLKTYIQLNAN